MDGYSIFDGKINKQLKEYNYILGNKFHDKEQKEEKADKLHDIYEEFPNALGKNDIIRLVANHPKDPLNDIKRAYEYIYTHSEVFMKWNELLKRATKEKGEELDLAKFHITCHELMYEGPENEQRRDKMNEQLRDEARKYLYQNKELTKEMDNIEREEKQR